LGRTFSEGWSFVSSDQIQNQCQGGKPGDPTAFRSPVLPFVLAVHYKIFGFNNNPPRITFAFISALSCFVMALFGWYLGFPLQGLLAAAIWAIWPADILSDFALGRLYPETMCTLFFLGSFTLMAAYLKHKQTAFLIGSAFLLGLSTLTRGYIALIIPLMVLFVFFTSKQKFKAALIFALCSFVLVGGWMTRNWIMLGKPVLSTQTDPFFTGNNQWARGSIDGEIFFKKTESQQFQYILSKHPNALEMTELERSGMWTKEAVHAVSSNPKHFIWLIPRKTLIFFGPFQNWSAGFYKYHYAFLLMLLFAFTGLSRLRKTDDRKKIILLLIPMFGVYSAMLLTYALDRYRFTIEPFVVILGAIGLIECLRYISRKRSAIE